MAETIDDEQPEWVGTLERINQELHFPCAICKVSFGQHNMGQLKVCFQSIAAALLAVAREQREKDAVKCEGLVTFTEEHGCTCEPCAWCEALEQAATAIRNGGETSNEG